MLKGHPKGLVVAFFANMGERFGFYTMMGILVFFLQAKYGLSGTHAGLIYSIFYFSIYGLSILGGIIADHLTRKGKRGLGQTITLGIVIMFLGYIFMTIPLNDKGTVGLVVSIVSLFIIAFGNGLFKGNLQAMVGNLYEAPQYAHLRDRAFSLFYMGINIGAFFAPNAARGIRTWYLGTQGLKYDNAIPELAHRYMNGEPIDVTKFQELANEVTINQAAITNLSEFSRNYIDAISTGFHYAFGVAGIAMLISLAVYLGFKKFLRAGDLIIKSDDDKSIDEDTHGATVVKEMSGPQVRQRFIAMILVMLVVMFFWMSFHQNGLTLSLFARDYVVREVGPLTYMFFDLKSLLSFIAVVIGIVLVVQKSAKAMNRMLGGVLILAGGFLSFYFYSTYGTANQIEPETFQHFNPIFIVFLTPVVVGFFAWLYKRGKEPSTPRKIGIGMILAAVGFLVMVIGSRNLIAPSEIATAASYDRVSPYFLINTYLILTIAELFLSPMGISFFSKVAPPKFKGLAQGMWLGATALGNLLLFVGTELWERVELWQVWAVFVTCCILSAIFIFSIMKKLERATSD
ncbi:MAG: peptide MFS transporter [Bacteroidales bacterium]